MLKFTIEIKENKEKDSCKVTLTNPKDLTKCTENEKIVGANLRNKIDLLMNELEKGIDENGK